LAKFRLQKNSLIAGEISPTAQGRTDLPIYQHACKQLKNMIPLPSGGAYARPGSLAQLVLNEIAPGTDYFAPAMIPFVYSKDEAYALFITKEVGGSGVIGHIRATSNSGAATASFAIGAAHPYQEATINTMGGSTPIYDEWHEVQTVQSADVLYLVHPNYKPMKLSRIGQDSFELEDFDYGLAGTGLRDAYPYLPKNTNSLHTITVTDPVGAAPIALGTAVTLSASQPTFDADHVGSVFKFNYGGANIGSVRITSVTNSTTAAGTVNTTIDAETATAQWWEPAWSDYRGWPRSIAFFEQRLCYGGSRSYPDSVWLSETADYPQMSHDSIDDPRSSPTGTQAFTIEMSSQQLNKIQWLSSEKTLVVGTLGDEFIIEREVNTGGFGCDNASVQVQSHYGSGYYQAVRAEKELIFARASSDELQGLVFNEIEQAYVGDPIQTFADHFPKVETDSGNRRYRKFAWDGTRKVLWCCDTQGNLFGMTRDRTLQITAWHSHELGGYDDSIAGGVIGVAGDATLDPIYDAPTAAVVSLAVVPNPIIGTDDLWLATKRKIDGTWQFCVERIVGKGMQTETAFSATVPTAGPVMVDFAVYKANKYPAAEDYVIVNGNAMLPNTDLTGTALGAAGIFTVTATGGAANATIDTPYPTNYGTAPYVVILGLPFYPTLIPVRPEAGSQIGSAQGAIKRIHEASVRFHRTMTVSIGRDESNLEEIDFTDSTLPAGSSAEFFTGDKKVEVNCDYDEDGYLVIKREYPLPFTVVSISSTGMTYD
jgi:hypothetical protein